MERMVRCWPHSSETLFFILQRNRTNYNPEIIEADSLGISGPFKAVPLDKYKYTENIM